MPNVKSKNVKVLHSRAKLTNGEQTPNDGLFQAVIWTVLWFIHKDEPCDLVLSPQARNDHASCHSV